jgi:hypothetical protein
MRKHVLLSAELIHINGSRDKLFNQGAVYRIKPEPRSLILAKLRRPIAR